MFHALRRLQVQFSRLGKLQIWGTTLQSELHFLRTPYNPDETAREKTLSSYATGTYGDRNLFNDFRRQAIVGCRPKRGSKL